MRSLRLAFGLALRRRISGVVVGVSVAFVFLGFAQRAEPVLHEYFDFDAAPVAALGNTSNAPGSATAADALAQGNAAAINEGSSEYRLDGDTSRPDQVGYSDPFTPSVPPFKRLYAFDSVGSDFELIVADRRLRSLPVGGRPAPADDQFYADIPLVLIPGQPVRIPSVGPGARVLAAQTLPPLAFDLLRDSAENWFVRTQGAGGEYRLSLHLAIQRSAFGSAYAKVSWSRLARDLPRLPSNLLQEAEEVLTLLQLDHRTSPDEAVRQLVAYFRGFAPAEATLSGGGASLYRRIALLRQGVCRHRAFAFTVTALALGIPTRFVHNEAHAWVEVADGEIWHRIDLGGAAGQMAFGADLQTPQLTPPDPYAWPPNSESGQRLANDAFRRSNESRAGSAGAGTSGAAAPDPEREDTEASEPAPLSSAASTNAQHDRTPSSGADSEDESALPDVEQLPPSQVTVRSEAVSVRRGQRLTVAGQVSGGESCSLLRVEVSLVSGAVVERVGTLVTDAMGGFSGELMVPDRIPFGDYSIRASTAGNLRCGAGSTD